MDKKQLIEKISNSILYEEAGVLIYSKHIEAVTGWTGLPPEKIADINEKIEFILKESIEHKKKLEKVKHHLERKA